MTQSELLDQIERFLLRHQMAPTAFGLYVVNDPNIVRDLRSGDRSPSLKTVQRLVDFMEGYESDRDTPKNVKQEPNNE